MRGLAYIHMYVCITGSVSPEIPYVAPPAWPKPHFLESFSEYPASGSCALLPCLSCSDCRDVPLTWLPWCLVGLRSFKVVYPFHIRTSLELPQLPGRTGHIVGGYQIFAGWMHVVGLGSKLGIINTSLDSQGENQEYLAQGHTSKSWLILFVFEA